MQLRQRSHQNFYEIFTRKQFFCQLLQVTRKRSCTSAGNAQAQLHFRDDQQRAFGISNISNWNQLDMPKPKCYSFTTKFEVHTDMVWKEKQTYKCLIFV